MAKRSNGEGSVRQRANGRWEARFSYRDADDMLVRKSLYGRDLKEARAKMRAALDRVARDLPPTDDKSSMAAWIDQWEAMILTASDRKETTKELYRGLAKHHLKPEPFGALPLGAVKPRHIDALLVRLRDEKGLSQSTVRNIYAVLRSVLEGAVRDGLIADNPVARVPRPGVARQEARHLAPAEVKALLLAAFSSRYQTALTLIAGTGLRRGEALGIGWADLDLEKSLLHVRKTLGRVNGALILTEPKTENSRRDVVLTPSMVRMLQAHRKTQVTERLRAGNQWADSGLVFTTELGGPVDPRNLFRVFSVAAKAAGLEGVGLHTLRHSAATALLDGGVPLHVVSRILGHSSVAITGDIYGHLVDSTQRDAMETLASALGI